ncbi:hypothetical protein AYI70_g6838 [Smittium culicis]|uniref:Uncharacterized protein n=1 Tax=Smittium culicis TaxID=133412 RepID=A0A1R1XN75_9FUNG|nr:hypothetical protein AYI70_g6838 [Smittium culicis]
MTELTDELISDKFNSEESPVNNSSSKPVNIIDDISIGGINAGNQFYEPDWDIDSNVDTESLFGSSAVQNNTIVIFSDEENI